MKGTIQPEDITLVNTHTPNIAEPKYVKQILMDINREINRNTVIVGDFNIPLTSVDRSSRQKINKETATLNDTLDQMDLIGIFRAFHPKAAGYTYFSSTYGMLFTIDHIEDITQVLVNLGRLKSYQALSLTAML